MEISNSAKPSKTPLEPSKSAIKSPTQQPYSGPALVVDDEPDLRELMSYFLTRLGFSVDLAENGEVALKMLQKNTYNLVLTDIQMPILRGDLMIEQAKSFSTTKNTVFIVVTGNLVDIMPSDESARIKSLAHGTLPKPFSLEIIRSTLSKLLPTKR